jgi:hypothetical protein
VTGVQQSLATASGLWVPTLVGSSGGSATLTVATGRWTLIGNLVTASFSIAASDVSMVAGAVSIGNLPFTAANLTNIYGGGPVVQWGNVTLTGYLVVSALVGPNTSSAGLRKSGSGVASVGLMAEDLDNTSSFYGMLQYTI